MLGHQRFEFFVNNGFRGRKSDNRILGQDYSSNKDYEKDRSSTQLKICNIYPYHFQGLCTTAEGAFCLLCGICRFNV